MVRDGKSLIDEQINVAIHIICIPMILMTAILLVGHNRLLNRSRHVTDMNTVDEYAIDAHPALARDTQSST